MSAPKGHPGYKPKRPNKVTREIRLLLRDFTQENFEEVVKSWREIKSPSDKVKTFAMLLRFVVPFAQGEFTEEEKTRLIQLLSNDKERI